MKKGGARNAITPDLPVAAPPGRKNYGNEVPAEADVPQEWKAKLESDDFIKLWNSKAPEPKPAKAAVEE